MPSKPLLATHLVTEIDSTVGYCCDNDSAEWRKVRQRSIWVSSRQSDWEQFLTLHHEWLHRIFPRLSEAEVLAGERDFGAVVKKFFVVKRRKVARKRRKKA